MILEFISSLGLESRIGQFKTGDWKNIALDEYDAGAADLAMHFILESTVFPGKYVRSKTESISFILGKSHSFLVTKFPDQEAESVYENSHPDMPFHESSKLEITNRYRNLILNGSSFMYSKLHSEFRNSVPVENHRLINRIEELEAPSDYNRRKLIRKYADKFINVHKIH